MAEEGQPKKGFGARLAGLFGGGGQGKAAPAEPVSYKGFEIRPTPKRQGSGWLTAGVITKEVDGETREHSFVRADTHTSVEDAVAFTVRKAQQIIDEQEKTLLS